MDRLPLTFPLGSSDKLLRVSSADKYYLIEYISPPDNRYTPEFIDAYLEAISFIRTQLAVPKVLITTSPLPKFFSNGLDFERALATPNFFPDRYYRLMRAMLEFPWPTVAVINGHAFAAGFMIASCHDYRVMNPDRGFLCMNELDFGAPLFPPMMSIFKVRFGAALAHKITLTAHRFTGKEALEYKLVDVLGGLPEGIRIAESVFKFASSPAYGPIRKELFKEVISDTHNYEVDAAFTARRLEQEQEYYEGREEEIAKNLSKL